MSVSAKNNPLESAGVPDSTKSDPQIAANHQHGPPAAGPPQANANPAGIQPAADIAAIAGESNAGNLAAGNSAAGNLIAGAPVDTDPVALDEPVDPETPIDLEEKARICLQHSPYRAIRRVDCTISEGVLTLTGQVPTYHYKQLAQTAISQLPGVEQIVNSIDVG